MDANAAKGVQNSIVQHKRNRIPTSKNRQLQRIDLGVMVRCASNELTGGGPQCLLVFTASPHIISVHKGREEGDYDR